MSVQRGQPLETSRKRDEDRTILWVLIILVVLVLGAMGFGLYLLFATAPPEVVAAVVVATGTVLVSVLTYFFSRQLERSRARQQKEHEQRAESYQAFMDFCLQVLTEEEALKQSERTERFHAFSRQLIVWGSDAFLERYLDFKTYIDLERYRAYKVEITELTIAKTLLEFEQLLLTIRTDLNNDSKPLPEGTLLKMFLKNEDVNKIMQVTKARSQLPSPQKEDKSYEPV